MTINKLLEFAKQIQSIKIPIYITAVVIPNKLYILLKEKFNECNIYSGYKIIFINDIPFICDNFLSDDNLYVKKSDNTIEWLKIKY